MAHSLASSFSGFRTVHLAAISETATVSARADTPFFAPALWTPARKKRECKAPADVLKRMAIKVGNACVLTSVQTPTLGRVRLPVCHLALYLLAVFGAAGLPSTTRAIPTGGVAAAARGPREGAAWHL